MNINEKSRAELKSYFVKNAMPTESNFADLINGMLNQKDDGIAKLPNDPLSIQAVGSDDSQKKTLSLYRSFADPKPAWVLSLNPRSSTGGASPGLSFGDGDGNSRLFIDQTSGNVGINTTAPAGKLDVRGGILAGNSDLYFTNPNHSHTGLGNKPGHAAIENEGAHYNALMILGRTVSVSPLKRVVKVWDYLEVNGSFAVKHGSNLFAYNGAADVVLKCPARGSGGRAIVHWTGDSLAFNYAGDFNGGIIYWGAFNKASSRQLKENVTELTSQDAWETLTELNPVRYHLKSTADKRVHLGFIAEDVPELIATSDRKAITTDHIVAVLTKVVKEQQKAINALTWKVNEAGTASA